MNDIAARLTRCFSAVFPSIPEQQIATASLETVEGWDSVAAATLVVTIEEEFGIEFEAEVLGNLSSYQSIFDYLSGLPVREQMREYARAPHVIPNDEQLTNSVDDFGPQEHQPPTAVQEARGSGQAREASVESPLLFEIDSEALSETLTASG